ncbi:MAG: endolytic transglycosylase MltG [Flavobacteriaceae bacterium]
MNSKIKILLGGGGALLFSLLLLFSAIFYWDNTSFETDTATIYVESDWDFESLQEALAPHLKSSALFAIAAKAKGYSSRVRSGKYEIAKGLSNNEIINRLRLKSDPITITFNNQERLENLAGRLAQVLEPDSLSFLTAMNNAAFLKAKGFTSQTALAMYLPNSYEFFWDVLPAVFCERIYKEYQTFWNSTRRAQANQQGLTPVEVITLASIVHKEAVHEDERKVVAGVYLNRLRRRMKLQADPTVIYALKERFQNFDTVLKRVLYKDLRIQSPYNTYRVKKLPPGPIAMPDISAIEAVLSPQKHRYLYFVANPDRPGYHLFAATLRDHNRNKRKYVQWLNRKKLYR